MIRNYVKTALRNFRKQPSFAFIHIVGLSLGMLASLVIFLFVYFHLSTDTFYPHADRMYRVVLDMHIANGSIEYESGTSLPMAQALKDEYASIEQVGFCMPFYSPPEFIIQPSEGKLNRFIENNGVAYADTWFLQMFDYHFIEGDSETALSAPNQAVLTQQQATIYFGESSALGKTIRINDKTDLVVTGVIKDYPKNTDFTTNVWVSLPTLKVLQPAHQTENFSWIGSNNWTFVKLSENSKAATINEQLPAFVSKYLGDNFKHWHFHLQPLREMHFDTRYGGTVRKPLLYLLSAVALFIILMACINFINLSTAQALSRSQEVGVRKALGSSRPQLFWQFMTETSLIVGIALFVVLLTVSLGLPWLNGWIHTQLTMQPLTEPAMMGSLLIFILGLIFLAGSYPALVLSGFHPIRALKSKVNAREAGGHRLRKLLVTLQFTISQAFIIGALVVVYQMNYFQRVDTGFTKEAIVTVNIPKSTYSRLDAFRNQLSQHPSIRQVSFHHRPPMATMNDGGYVKYNNRTQWEPFLVRDRWADEQYLETYDLTLLAGRNLIMRDSVTEFLVNEEFVEKLGASSPEEVVGKPLLEGNVDVRGVIVGVVKNFHHRSLQNPIEPLVIYSYPRLFRQAGIQLRSENLPQILHIIRQAWEVTFPDQVFSYQFLEETLAQLYKKERTIAKLTRIFALVSIVICGLGLIGLATYTARQRTQEIGIRKVLGASVPGILLLLSKDFMLLMLLGFVLSIPIANYFMQEWLTNFAHRICIQWWMFALSGLLVVLIALLSVGSQTLKAARRNPVDSLRYE